MIIKNAYSYVEDSDMSQVKRVASDEISQVSLKISKVDDDGANPKELARLEKQKQKEAERAERERRKEEERIERERRKEEERQEKERKREEERIEKEKRREEERIAKELKKQKLLEEKHERERKREEEKEKKQAERERQKLERKRKMDEEKERKEQERRLAEEERKRAEELKERSQMKISSFFQVGKVKDEKSKEVATTHDSSSYDREFLPFFVQKNVVMAESGQMGDEELAKSKQDFDALIKSSLSETTINTTKPTKDQNSQLSQNSQNLQNLVQKKVTPQDIITALNAANTTEAQVYSMLQQIPPIKYISFYENSKPPYVGTWCSKRHRIQLPISNPIDTSLTGLDYDYDSDLEWNKEDEEGEDLDDDDEEEDEVLEDDDIEDFVENNQEGGPTRKFHSLVVVSKWNDGTNDDFFSSLSTTVCVDIPTPVDPTYTKQVPEVITPAVSKKTIQDPEILKGLVEFIEKNQDFTIGTLVELSKKEFKEYTKAMLKSTIQAMAVYNKKTSNWHIKPEVKSSYKIPT